eukprot:NODE_19436_length_843_cov_4.099162.p1 GENE.NODE_19436_length_843_cov_4.099162~~NODE_19436_length_843_cov_4.099162.p1  ORF type:complete len:166 (+),score=14.89 NODE_19436_length_843_cov_4.099162:203-700(+)
MISDLPLCNKSLFASTGVVTCVDCRNSAANSRKLIPLSTGALVAPVGWPSKQAFPGVLATEKSEIVKFTKKGTPPLLSWPSHDHAVPLQSKAQYLCDMYLVADLDAQPHVAAVRTAVMHWTLPEPAACQMLPAKEESYLKSRHDWIPDVACLVDFWSERANSPHQ